MNISGLLCDLFGMGILSGCTEPCLNRYEEILFEEVTGDVLLNIDICSATCKSLCLYYILGSTDFCETTIDFASLNIEAIEQNAPSVVFGVVTRHAIVEDIIRKFEQG